MRFEIPLVIRSIFLIALMQCSCTLGAQNLDSLIVHKRTYTSMDIKDYDFPKIDGLLNDSIWTLGEWQGNFTQQQPYGNTPATESTYVKVLYDHSNLYIAIICQDDEPHKIREVFDKRDEFNGDMAGVAIDSYYDKRTAFEFNLSAAGQKVDLKHLGDYEWDTNWDAVWDGASARCDSGWVAEMKIPFSQIRYTNLEEHTWGLHVWRWISRKKEEDQWQFIPREAPAMVYLFGNLNGIKDIRSSRQVEFLPYALSSLEKPLNESLVPGFNAGVDAKIGISSDFTLDLTVNPDFGQVEADPSVLNLSSYETFYDEKRPFFLEGNDVFDFALDNDIPYYSRRIGSSPQFDSYYDGKYISDIPDQTTILSAAKFTGKTKDGLSFGLVNGLTAKEYGYYEIEGAAEGEGAEMERIEVSPLSNYMASRVKKEFKEGNSSVGAFVSLVNRFQNGHPSSAMVPDQAYTGGVDALHQWKNRNYFMEAKWIGSQLKGSQEAILIQQMSHNHRYQRPDANYLEVDSSLTMLSGHGGFLKVGKKGGRWNFSTKGQYRSPGLNLNDMGYIAQSDYFGLRNDLTYRMNEPKGAVLQYVVKLYQDARWNFGGEVERNHWGTDFTLTFKNFCYIMLGAKYRDTHYDSRQLRGGPSLRNDPVYNYNIYAGTNSAKDFHAFVGYYHEGASVENYIQNSVFARLTWLPHKKLSFSAEVSHGYTEYYQQFVGNFATTEGPASVVADISRSSMSATFRAELFINPEISLQYYGNPYFSVGDYSNFRTVAQSNALAHNLRYEEPQGLSYYANTDIYSFGYPGDSHAFYNPDFSFFQYRSNIVFRWEYKLGSTLYFVWSHNRGNYERGYQYLFDTLGDMFLYGGDNIFMMKLNYWFSL